jgi:plastocyanin
MARSRVVALLAMLVVGSVGLPQAGAQASGTAPSAIRVETLNYVFIPDPVRIQVGQSITWHNSVDGTHHTATSDAPLSLWDSGEIPRGRSYSFTFTAAGGYPYTCTLHLQFNMVSSVGVSPQARPPSGPVGTVFTVTVATIPAPADFVYDVQKRDPGGAWQNWMVGVTTQTVEFDSTGSLTGVYRFRSRLHRLSDGATSNYSPLVAVSVT